MDHQPLNTGEQKDMAEFFIDLVSKLEEMTPDLKDLVKRLFCGTLSNNVVSLDCDHVSRTAEEFYTVRCQVADMRNLQESLDEVTVKDTLEGDNMYTCSQCGKKVRAEKRACFKSYRRFCFNTMRYTFNMVTMLKEKPTMVPWVELLTKQFNASQEACEWFLTHMSIEPWWPVQVLIQCPNQMVRQMFQRLVIHVIQRLRLLLRFFELAVFLHSSILEPQHYRQVARSQQLEVGSDNDDNSSDEALSVDKTRPASLDKMIALVASLVERSRGQDLRLKLSTKDYNAIAGGK
ncbi:Ubiquitin carboxyl-terminal hydrolase puf, partial [Eumeta japonica]